MQGLIEHLSGVSLRNVQVHYNTEESLLKGTDIVEDYPNIYIASGQEGEFVDNAGGWSGELKLGAAIQIWHTNYSEEIGLTGRTLKFLLIILEMMRTKLLD